MEDLSEIVNQLDAIDEAITRDRIAMRNRIDALATNQLILTRCLLRLVVSLDTEDHLDVRRLKGLEASLQAFQDSLRKKREG